MTGAVSPATEALDAPPALRLPFDVAELDAAQLRTERMSLRPIANGDADDVWRYQRLPALLRYIPWLETDRDGGVAHTRERAQRRVLARDGDSFALVMVVDGRVLGDITIIVASAADATIELGWIVNPEHAGRGLASEAARAVLDWAFERLHAHRVIARLDVRNVASARLCARIGMRQEAVLLADQWFKGEWTDTEIWAMLRRDWHVSPAGVAFM